MAEHEMHKKVMDLHRRHEHEMAETHARHQHEHMAMHGRHMEMRHALHRRHEDEMMEEGAAGGSRDA
jgi:hypothetical protein